MKKVISLVALASIGLGLAAAAPQDGTAKLVAAQKARIEAYKAKPEAKPHVAFVSNGVADFWTIAKAGAIAAGKQLGCDVTVEFPGGGLGDQKRMLEDLVIKGIDGISVSPIDPANQVEVMNLVAEKSILITNDSDAPKAPRLCYIGMDNYEAGLMCGKLAREGTKNGAGGGKVAIFIGRLEQDNAKRRRQGFIDGLLGRTPDPTRYDEPSKVFTEGGYTFVGTWTDSFDRAKAKANIEDVMIKNPDLALMSEPAEKALLATLDALGPKVTSLVQDEDYTAALKLLAGARAPVDAFFDQVMVMAEEQSVRLNRLALLGKLERLMNAVADISRLAA
jgi:ABC-type sugar transport system substrate-binding protein